MRIRWIGCKIGRSLERIGLRQKLWSRHDRYTDRKRRAFAEFAANRHPPAQHLGKRLDNVEAEPDALKAAGLRTVYLIEAIEYLVALFRRDPDSTVGYPKLEPVLRVLLVRLYFFFRRNNDAAFLGEFVAPPFRPITSSAAPKTAVRR